jgi:hypothetical protein
MELVCPEPRAVWVEVRAAPAIVRPGLLVRTVTALFPPIEILRCFGLLSSSCSVAWSDFRLRGGHLVASSSRPLLMFILVFEDDKLVLFFVVTVFLISRECRQGNIVSLDDLGHELVIILGIAVIGGMVKIHGVLDR